MVPARSDRRLADAAGRASFAELLEAGVRIHRHQTGMLHAKSLTLDDRITAVGSANGDRRSFYLDDEVVALLYDRELTQRVRWRQERCIEESERVVPEVFHARSQWQKTCDDVAALASPLLEPPEFGSIGAQRTLTPSTSISSHEPPPVSFRVSELRQRKPSEPWAETSHPRNATTCPGRTANSVLRMLPSAGIKCMFAAFRPISENSIIGAS